MGKSYRRCIKHEAINNNVNKTPDKQKSKSVNAFTDMSIDIKLFIKKDRSVDTDEQWHANNSKGNNEARESSRFKTTRVERTMQEHNE